MTTTSACDASASSSSNDELSLTQIRVEKQARRRELFEETDDGAVKVKQGEDTGALPWGAPLPRQRLLPRMRRARARDAAHRAASHAAGARTATDVCRRDAAGDDGGRCL